MRERPILFSGPLIPAILDGSKTQTRRVIRNQPPKCASSAGGEWHESRGVWRNTTLAPALRWACPYGVPGDHLWVRETWCGYQKTGRRYYRADMSYWDSNGPRKECGEPEKCRWRPSIHMPRWASRVTLELTEVRVQRVQEITVADAVAEGYPPGTEPADFGLAGRNRIEWYHQLWNSINEKRGFGWDKNPWIWVLTFKKVNTALAIVGRK